MKVVIDVNRKTKAWASGDFPLDLRRQISSLMSLISFLSESKYLFCYVLMRFVPYDINSGSVSTISIYPVLRLAGQSCAGMMEDENFSVLFGK
jgi:hypothetical protein